jgi:alkylglycerol monooxygenase
MATALRQSMLHKYYSFPAFVPMALLGIPPAQMLLHHDLNLLYQFWIHTEQIRKFPIFFEYLFNTPSHHRVHHGRNPYWLELLLIIINYY